MWLNRLFVKTKSLFEGRKKSPIIEGESSLERISNHLKMNNYKKIVVLTSKNILEIPIVQEFLAKLTRDKIEFAIYDLLNRQPTLDMVQKARTFTINFAPQAIVAIGGNGVVESAKMVSMAALQPSKTFSQIFGFGKLFARKLPLIVAPTTLGGGAENTAMVFLQEQKNMIMFSCPALLPTLVVIDPLLVEQIPNNVITYSAMESLGKAVESFVSCINFDGHNEYAPMAIKMIFDGLEKSLTEPNQLFKTKLQKASYLSGRAFQSEKAGYAFALANQIALVYNVHLGEAYSLVLPIVLSLQKQTIVKKLAFLCDYCLWGSTDQTDIEKANIFLQALDNLIDKIAVRPQITFVEGDFKKMVEATKKHVNRHHAPARFLSDIELYEILQDLKEK